MNAQKSDCSHFREAQTKMGPKRPPLSSPLGYLEFPLAAFRFLHYL
jgi:hypothetical protein